MVTITGNKLLMLSWLQSSNIKFLGKRNKCNDAFSSLCRLNLRVIFNPPDQPFDEYTVQLADDIDSWNLGDKIVIASTDYDMKQAEEVEVISLEGNLLTFKGMYFSFLCLPFKK